MEICKDSCTGCGSCYNTCPVNAIEMYENEKGFLIPRVDEKICVHCGLCQKRCPVNFSEYLFNPATEHAFAAVSADRDIQIKCTSGGIFTTIAKTAVDHGWIIYGAGYDDKFCVRHMRIDNREDISKLSESKYSQSIIGDSYEKVKEDLKKYHVLFSGTSCQIAGLRSYLIQQYTNLLCIDFICHGIPSGGIWNWYIDRLEQKYGSRPTTVRHKGKELDGWHWKKQFIQIVFDNKKELKENIWENSYMKGFLNDLYLRDSCYSCKFKNHEIKRVSDITLADYWGCEEVEKDFYDANGVSLVLINTIKGEEFFNKNKNCIKKSTNLKKALQYNIAAMSSHHKNKGYNLFSNTFKRSMTLEEFDILVDRCVKRKEFCDTWNLKILRRLIGKIWRQLVRKQHQKI